MAEEPERAAPYDWVGAAIDAERATGVHEVSRDAVRASLLVRVARVTAGTILTLVGVALLVLPGPGFVTIAAGLSILSIDVPFAQRLLQRVRERLPQDADGATPSWLLVTMGAGGVVAVVISVAFMII